MSQSGGDRMDVVYSLLGASERRYLLYQLRDQGRGNLETLTERVAAWKRGESPATLDEEAYQRTYISLVHNHLPRLADHGVVEYDLRSGDVVRSEGFEELETLLEQFRRTEDLPETGRSNAADALEPAH